MSETPSQEIVPTITAMDTAPSGGMLEVETTRAIQEVQAALVIAKRFPREEHVARERILRACCSRSLADVAGYEYARGGSPITGPSIRLAEEIVRHWGNIHTGVVEVEHGETESVMMAFAWDLETNARDSKTFTVKHRRHTKKGDYDLTDPRDIYEHTANFAARRKRACMMALIPKEVQDEAIAQCTETMKADFHPNKLEPMAAAFLESFNVTKPMLERRFGKKFAAFGAIEYARCHKIFRSLTDNMTTPEQFFSLENAGEAVGTVDASAIKAATAQPEDAPGASEQPATPEPGDAPPGAEAPPGSGKYAACGKCGAAVEWGKDCPACKAKVVTDETPPVEPEDAAATQKKADTAIVKLAKAQGLDDIPKGWHNFGAKKLNLLARALTERMKEE